MKTRIKICGIREPEHARVAADAGADAIGLNFAAVSPRRVTLEEAGRVIDALPAFVEPIGLFVDADPDQVRSTCRALGIRTVQFHGRETVEQAEALAPLRVIRAIAFDAGGSTSAEVNRWRGVTSLDGLLFDAPGAGGPTTGGTGRTLDWPALARMIDAANPASLPPAILAGGLRADNVAAAIQTVRPWAVDVSSGVEVRRGVKDPERIVAFCRQVRDADAAPDQPPR